MAALALFPVGAGGCAQFIRWGEHWSELREPLQDWGSEVVGYEGRQY